MHVVKGDSVAPPRSGRGANGVRFRSRVVGALAAACVLAISAVTIAVPATPAGAGADPAVAAEPTTGLGNQVVRVAWSGFTPTDELGNHAVFIYQCSAAPQSLQDCALDDPFPSSAQGNAVFTGFTGPDGAGSTFFEVRDGTRLPSLGCAESTPCSMLVFETGNPVGDDQLPPGAHVIPIEFAPSPTDCPPVDDFDVRVEGEASAAELFYSWAADRCLASDPLVIDYTETSSNSARASTLAGQVDVGITSLPATSDELEPLADPPALAYAPVNLNAITFAYFIIDPVTNERITDLTLSARLAARLITNTELLDFFNDPELRALNPGHDWPSLGVAPPLLRAERNADTPIVTSWIAQDTAAQRFLAGNDTPTVQPAYQDYPYPVDAFENASGDTAYQPRQGQHEVALRTFYGVRPADSGLTRPSVQGIIGILDRPTAERFELPTAKLVNAGGVAVAASDESVLAGFAAMESDEDGFFLPQVAPDDEAAYPLVKIDHAMITLGTASPATARAIASTLRFAAGEGQSNLHQGVTALPEVLRDRTREVAELVKDASPPPATTTTTSTIPPVTFPPPVFDSGCCSSGGGGFENGITPTSLPPSKTRAVPTATTRGPLAPEWQPIASVAPGSTSWLFPALLAVVVIAVTLRLGLGAWLALRRSRGDAGRATR